MVLVEAIFTGGSHAGLEYVDWWHYELSYESQSSDTLVSGKWLDIITVELLN